jgi:glycosyltransferase involved in cell wall biosynthesis
MSKMLVSCILPTRGRQEWARQAVECFLSQDYPNRELIVLDDSKDPSFEPGGFTDFPCDVLYQRSALRNIGAKRNMCCELTRGDWICHFDSDDWSAPDRISRQLRLLEDAGKSLVAFHSLLFYGPESGRVTKFVGQPGSNLGSSYLFKKSWWQAHRFPVSKITGEDSQFVMAAKKAGELVSVDAERLMVARAHAGNTSRKNPSSYARMTLQDLPKGFPL